MGKVVCFGEVLLCIRATINRGKKGPLVALPAECLTDFGSPEFSTAVGMGLLGRGATFVSVIPSSVAASNLLQIGTDAGVDMKHVMIDEQDDAEMGCELDAQVRRSQQRKYSSFHLRVDASNYDWRSILRGAAVFVGNALTLVVSEAARAAWVEAAYKARARKIPRILLMNWTPADTTKLGDLWYTIKPLLHQVKVSHFIVSEHTLRGLLKAEGIPSVNPEKDVAALRSVTRALMVACTFSRPAPGTAGQNHTFSMMAIGSGEVISTQDTPVQHQPIDTRTATESWLVGWVDSMLEHDDAAFKKMPASNQVRLLRKAGRRGDVTSALAQEHKRAQCRVSRSAVDRVLSQVTRVVVVGKAAELATRERLDALLQKCGVVPRLTPAVAQQLQASVEDIALALAEGGVRVLEVPFAGGDGVEVVRKVAAVLPKEVAVGVSGAVPAAAVQAVVAAGAQFVLTAGLLKDSVYACRALGVPVFPGVATATELGEALFTLNSQDVVFFPAFGGGGDAAAAALTQLMAYHPAARFLIYDEAPHPARQGGRTLNYVPYTIAGTSVAEAKERAVAAAARLAPQPGSKL
eukprot:TRINITY_DN6377_c0_g1_i1.p1 TRINITY_DN6377_c0_g1~~TRINITY_DN6377_c0_g1_i1.p1  ORF type:complete len:578 (+),score=240.92 TRINITY_DN6377_c0_g1_i1:127-1860(+)